MDVDNLTSFLASYSPSRVMAVRENGDMLVDRYHLDALTGRFEAERTVIRSGRVRRVNFVKRLFGFPELRTGYTPQDSLLWLATARTDGR